MRAISDEDPVATQERRVGRAAHRQGYRLVTVRRDVDEYSLRDDLTSVIENVTLSYCEAWLATPIGGDVSETMKRLRGD